LRRDALEIVKPIHQRYVVLTIGYQFPFGKLIVPFNVKRTSPELIFALDFDPDSAFQAAGHLAEP
jgi:hypothetical protein